MAFLAEDAHDPDGVAVVQRLGVEDGRAEAVHGEAPQAGGEVAPVAAEVRERGDPLEGVEESVRERVARPVAVLARERGEVEAVGEDGRRQVEIPHVRR